MTKANWPLAVVHACHASHDASSLLPLHIPLRPVPCHASSLPSVMHHSLNHSLSCRPVMHHHIPSVMHHSLMHHSLIISFRVVPSCIIPQENWDTRYSLSHASFPDA